MTFDRDAMRAAVRRLHPDDAARFGPAGPAFLAWLRSRRDPPAPLGLIDFYREFSVAAGGLKHFTPDVLGEDAIAGDIHNADPQYWREGLLVVGACGNGDPIVLDFTEGGGAIGYVSHEELYANPGDYRAVYVRVASSFAEFLSRALDDSLPTDYSDARPQRRSFDDYRYGFINRSGKLVIDFQFEEAQAFSEGVACVKAGGKWGVIDQAGRFLVPPTFLRLDAFENGLSFASLDTDGMTAEMVGRGHYGFIDKAGRFVIEPRYSYVSRFSEGLACVRIRHARGGLAGLLKWRAEWAGLTRPDTTGYVRADGSFAVEPVYESGSSFSEGFARVNDAKGYWYIDSRGEKVFGPFKLAHDFGGGVALVRDPRKGPCLLRRDGRITSVARYGHGVSSFAGCDRVEVRDGQYVGYLNSYGEMVIPPAFSDGSFFREDRAAVKVKRKWGAIDPAGNMVIEPAYDKSFWFRGGVARVERDGERFFIGPTGSVVLKPRYEPDDVFREDLAVVRQPV